MLRINGMEKSKHIDENESNEVLNFELKIYFDTLIKFELKIYFDTFIKI